MSAPAVLVDRDGTLIEDAGYIGRVDRMKIFAYSIEALRVLQAAGFRLVVVTNQAGVARGLFEESFLEEAHGWLRQQLEAGGVRLDGIYYCPHHPDASVAQYRRECDCRKPKPGMALAAARDLDLDLARSYVIGDTWLDIGLAQQMGGQGVLVRTGYGATEEQRPRAGVTAAAIVDHVHAAATWILGQQRARTAGGGRCA